MVKIMCNKCYELIEYENYDYWETEVEETLEEIECPKCKAKLEVYWEAEPNFCTREKEL